MKLVDFILDLWFDMPWMGKIWMLMVGFAILGGGYYLGWLMTS